jgi:ketosteroid isomerase-like protein
VRESVDREHNQEPEMTVANIEDFQALDPFFGVIKQGLAGLVDGEHFFDLLAEDVVTEFIVTVPGYPRRVEGRGALAELYRNYGDTIRLESADDLAVHYDREASVVVLEYAVHGHVVHTGRDYTNRFVSVITVADRKVTHWRDYLDSYAVMEAFSGDLPDWK